MLNVKKADLLGLSPKENKVLSALQKGFSTPLAITRETKVSRPAIYHILKLFKTRGLADPYIKDGKKYWKIAHRKELEQRFFETKRAVLNLSEGTSEIFGVGDSVAIIHRGEDAIKKLFAQITYEHKNERLYGFQGDVAATNWNKIFSAKETNALNRAIKENSIIVEAVLPRGWFERQTKELGVEWAKDFEGRMTRTSTINEEYFRHGGQLFVFKNSIYLMALGEELVIEIRNSEIQKMLLAFLQFIKDHSEALDVNALLRDLIAKPETKKQ